MHSLLDISQTNSMMHKTNNLMVSKNNILGGSAYPIEPMRLYPSSSVIKQDSHPSHVNSCFSSLHQASSVSKPNDPLHSFVRDLEANMNRKLLDIGYLEKQVNQDLFDK